MPLAACVCIYINVHSAPDEGRPYTLPDLFAASEELTREVAGSVPAMLEGQVVHQEVFLLRQFRFELATLAPSDLVEVRRLRCALQGGLDRALQSQAQLAALVNHVAAVHVDSIPFSLAPKAGVGISERLW